MPTNCTIEFEAKRDLIAGVTAGDSVSLEVELTAFDYEPQVSRKQTQTMDGSYFSSLFYIKRAWSMTMTEYGKFTYANSTTEDITADHVEMFWQSVINHEDFTITDLDKSDLSRIVCLIDVPSRTRRAANRVNMFEYSFNVAEK